MKPLHSTIEQQIENYTTEKVTIIDTYEFSQYDTLQKIENLRLKGEEKWDADRAAD